MAVYHTLHDDNLAAVEGGIGWRMEEVAPVLSRMGVCQSGPRSIEQRMRDQRSQLSMCGSV